MGRPRSIPERLAEAVLAMAGEGLSTRKIAGRLKAEHKLTIGHNAVAAFLRERRGERRAAAEAVIAERAGKSLTADLDARSKLVAEQLQVVGALRNLMLDEQGKPLPGLTDCIGKTPIAMVHATAVARAQALLDKNIAATGADNAVGGVLVMPLEDPNA